MYAKSRRAPGGSGGTAAAGSGGQHPAAALPRGPSVTRVTRLIEPVRTAPAVARPGGIRCRIGWTFVLLTAIAVVAYAAVPYFTASLESARRQLRARRRLRREASVRPGGALRAHRRRRGRRSCSERCSSGAACAQRRRACTAGSGAIYLDRRRRRRRRRPRSSPRRAPPATSGSSASARSRVLWLVTGMARVPRDPTTPTCRAIRRG